MGVDLKPVALPNLPYGDMSPLLTAEAAAAFDDLTMSGRDKLLTDLIVDAYNAVGEVAEAAAGDSPRDRWLAIWRATREWARARSRAVRVAGMGPVCHDESAAQNREHCS